VPRRRRVHQRSEFNTFALRPLGQQLHRLLHHLGQIEVERFEMQFAGLNFGKVRMS